MSTSEEKSVSADDAMKAAVAAWLTAQTDHNRIQRRELHFRMARSVLVIISVLAFAVSSLVSTHFSGNTALKGGYVTGVRLEGPIAPDGTASVSVMQDALERAFADNDARGVVLVVNSPGGYPGQSELIYRMIRRMASDSGKRVIAVAEDQMTSGAYLISMSADHLYAPVMATVGSIGVVQQGINYSGLAQRYGVTDMTFTSGNAKHRFNPLTPVTEADTAKATDFLGELHQEFIAIVKESRGARLQGEESKLFSGDYWTGRQAKDLGLIDDNLPLRDAVLLNFDVSQVKMIEPRISLGGLLRMAGKSSGPF